MVQLNGWNTAVARLGCSGALRTGERFGTDIGAGEQAQEKWKRFVS